MDLNIDIYQYEEARIMSRVQLALNVSNIDSAVDFYSKLFATEPAKRRQGYANFARSSALWSILPGCSGPGSFHSGTHRATASDGDSCQ